MNIITLGRYLIQSYIVKTLYGDYFYYNLTNKIQLMKLSRNSLEEHT